MRYKLYTLNQTGLQNLENWFHMILRDADILIPKRLAVLKDKQFHGNFENEDIPHISIDMKFTNTGKDEDYPFSSHEMTEVFMETLCPKSV
jgi:hypothetical protein